MRKALAIMFSVILLFTMAACGKNNENTGEGLTSVSQADSSETTEREKQQMSLDSGNEIAEAYSGTAEESKILIAYFSRVGNTDFPENVDAVSSVSLNLQNGELMGNTEVVAFMIQQAAGGDLFRIETEKKYPSDYDELVDYGREEPTEDSRPVLGSHVDNMEDYDVVFLGFPNWWFDMPMAVYSFLDEYDLSGKTIIPFCTHGGSRFSDTIATLEEQLKDSTILEGFEVYGEDATEAQGDVSAWIERLGLMTE